MAEIWPRRLLSSPWAEEIRPCIALAGQVLRDFERAEVPLVRIADGEVPDVHETAAGVDPERRDVLPFLPEIVQDSVDDLHAGRGMTVLHLAPDHRPCPWKTRDPPSVKNLTRSSASTKVRSTGSTRKIAVS